MTRRDAEISETYRLDVANDGERQDPLRVILAVLPVNVLMKKRSFWYALRERYL